MFLICLFVVATQCLLLHWVNSRTQIEMFRNFFGEYRNKALLTHQSKHLCCHRNKNAGYYHSNRYKGAVVIKDDFKIEGNALT